MSKTETEINWGFNCLTEAVYHGRPETLWDLPLNYVIDVFSKNQLALLVFTRIHRDALQITVYGYNEQYTTEWANRVRAHAEEHYNRTLQHTVGEISLYYKSAGFETDLNRAVELFEKDKLNQAYEPLHPHDSINMLCRILGMKSKTEARDELFSSPQTETPKIGE